MTPQLQLKIAKLGYLIIAALLCALGIAFLVLPESALQILSMIGGILILAFGIIKIIGYLAKDLYRLAFQYDLAFGILMIAVSTILIFRNETILHIICVLLGIMILADGLLKIQISIDAKAFGIHYWWLILIFAVLTGLCGFLLALRPFRINKLFMLLLGISLIVEGILSAVTVLTAVEIIKDRHAEIAPLHFYQ